MAWTYTGNPGTVPRDAVRLHLGDTVQAPTSLTDAEIDYLLDEADGSTGLAAAAAADLWAGRFAGLSASSKSIGDMSISHDHGATSTRLYALAARLRGRHGGLAVPLMADTRPAVFAVGQDDNPGWSTGDGLARYF